MVTQAQKEERVTVLKEKLERSQITIISDYRGLTVKEMTTLRRQLRETGAEYVVEKNTLIKKAMDGDPLLEKIEALLHGPTALVFGFDDPVGPTKALMKYVKENDKELPALRGALFEGQRVELAGLKQIAELPSREQMIAKLLGSMQAPAQGLVMVMSGVTRQLAYVLEAIRQQKEKEQ